MTPTPVLIGGATGATGSIAAKRFLEKGFRVRALVHNDDERAHRLQALGAEIFVGDVLDFRAVRRAFEGMKRAYFVYPLDAIAEMHHDGQMAETNDVVEKITGRKPQSVAEFVEKHRAAFQ
ncbi:NmrA family NAD(P)-binding protein [Bradyrhizobium sp. Arg237L]|uniref:NmrA family NAD(P)-binding protein n=1 Tax=Bradyrhizobium sp. Arg237L TaxID=3003352 RepID=UPI00249EC19D|nr:NmrA family NAD(P)-binding protein [Bradyrhizobium sp. Arg237L]MDI4231412.1 NmrA family NAD(P)-binding protein [Bradyrhizobium sp. Arg237L]